jgi:hypothetical protein
VSGFTLQSGRRTAEVSCVCPICTKRWALTNERDRKDIYALDYVPLKDLACTHAHRQRYVAKVHAAVTALGYPWMLENTVYRRYLDEGRIGCIADELAAKETSWTTRQ